MLSEEKKKQKEDNPLSSFPQEFFYDKHLDNSPMLET